MYYLAQSPSSSNTEPVIRHSFTLPSLSTISPVEVILNLGSSIEFISYC